MNHAGRPHEAFVRIVALSVVLTVVGCRQPTRVEQSRARLQTMVASNTRQIATLAAPVERSRQQLQADIGHVANTADTAIVEIACARDEQATLYQFLQSQNQQTMLTTVGLPIAPRPTAGE